MQASKEKIWSWTLLADRLSTASATMGAAKKRAKPWVTSRKPSSSNERGSVDLSRSRWIRESRSLSLTDSSPARPRAIPWVADEMRRRETWRPN
eukprot:768781-Hanusia_phi.AAC.14